MVQEHHSYCPWHIPLAFYNILGIFLRSPAVVKVMIHKKCVNSAIYLVEYEYWKCLCQRKETFVLVELKSVSVVCQNMPQIYMWSKRKTNPWLSHPVLKTKIHVMWLLCTIPVASVEDMIGWKVSRPINQVNILTDREMIFPALGARYMYMARVVIH